MDRLLKRGLESDQKEFLEVQNNCKNSTLKKKVLSYHGLCFGVEEISLLTGAKSEYIDYLINK
tara:strand:+ start:758 stop:946 length:189 start_codon:yes stop_codon:yes gene_type:complete